MRDIDRYSAGDGSLHEDPEGLAVLLRSETHCGAGSEVQFVDGDTERSYSVRLFMRRGRVVTQVTRLEDGNMIQSVGKKNYEGREA